MLRSKGEYRIERWSAGGVPLVCVRPTAAPTPLPVVVVYHRFSGRNTDDLIRLALPLADSGVAAVLPESALHGERAPMDFDERLAADRDDLFTDVLGGTVDEAGEVLAWIGSRGDLDPSRIGVVGTSMGGAVSLADGFGVVDRTKIGVGAVALHEAVFPLNNHAQVLVVEQHDFDRQLFADAGGQFLNIHQDATVAVDIDHELVRIGSRGTHGGR